MMGFHPMTLIYIDSIAGGHFQTPSTCNTKLPALSPIILRLQQTSVKFCIQGRIEVNVLLIERKWDSLTVTHRSQSAHGTNVTTFQLVSSNVTSFLLPEGVVIIRFCSDEFVVHNGFAFDIRTLAINGSLKVERNWHILHNFTKMTIAKTFEIYIC